jgi:hypothetical protein
MNMLWLLFGLGTLASLAYLGFGVAASSYFKDKAMGGSDRFFSTGMLWSLASGRYEEQGKKLCVKGNVALVVALVSWIAWAVLQ